MCPEVEVLFDGDDVHVRCEVCGRTCRVPSDLPVRALQAFYDLHPDDKPVADHATTCPPW